MERDGAKKVKFLINGKIDVLWEDGIYKSTIGDVTDEYIAMSIPVYEGRYLPFVKGEQFEAVYYYEEELYKFFTVVIGRKVDRIPLILFDIPNKLEPYQRRNYVRIPHIDSIGFRRIDEKHVNSKQFPNIELSQGLLIDLSGGGLRFISKEPVKLGDILYINLFIYGELIKVKGRVVRHSINEDKKNVCGVAFLDLDRKDREKVIKFTFTKMREQRNKSSKEE